MPPPESLTIEIFNPLHGSIFTVVSTENPISLELIEIKSLGAGLREGGAFSLLWQGPTEPLLQQSMYRCSHSDLGELDFFLVPVASQTAGYHYEAVFT